MRRWFVLLVAMMGAIAGLAAAPASAVDSPIGQLGETLRVQFKGLIADVAVTSIDPSEVPPGFGYPPRAPRHQVFRGNVTITPVQLPTPFAMAITFQFRGVTPTGDAYEPRNTDSPDALQHGMQRRAGRKDLQRRRVVGLLSRPGDQCCAHRQYHRRASCSVERVLRLGD